MNQYEAMFLFDPTFGASFENCETEIKRLIDRAKGEIIVCKVWDERRLAYKINGCKRGVYVLTYMNAPADSIGSFERDAKLSEPILRLLVLRAEGMTPEAMEQVFVARKEEARANDEYEEGRGRFRRDDRGDRGDRGDRDRGDRRPPRPRDREPQLAAVGDAKPSSESTPSASASASASSVSAPSASPPDAGTPSVGSSSASSSSASASSPNPSEG